MMYTVNAKNFQVGLIFAASNTHKIKPMKICSQEELATVITVATLTREILSRQKFHPQNIVTTKISTFMEYVNSMILPNFTYNYSSYIAPFSNALLTTDPARIQPYDIPSGESEESVTTSELKKKFNETVTICCSFTGIGETSATWTAVNLDNDTVDLTTSTYVIDNRITHTMPTTDPGLSCISFSMLPDTQGAYTCTVENDVIDPVGQQRSSTVTLDRGKPTCKIYVFIRHTYCYGQW